MSHAKDHWSGITSDRSHSQRFHRSHSAGNDAVLYLSNPNGIDRAGRRQMLDTLAALIRDLKQHGLLEDTLVVCSGEFGRTVYCQGKLTADNYGRDHHGRCFSS